MFTVLGNGSRAKLFHRPDALIRHEISPDSSMSQGALSELGGARRIVEDEVRDRAGRYGTQSRRVLPKDISFVDRRLREPMELTSRVSTDDVAKAKQRLRLCALRGSAHRR
jgi:hypothetical protein